MAFRSLTRGLFQLATHRRFYSSVQQHVSFRKPLFTRAMLPCRSFASMQTDVDAYRDLNQFLEKEVKLEKSAQRHPSQLPKVQGYEVETKGPEVILTRQSGKDKVKVTFNVTNTVNASESDQGLDADASGQPATPVGEASSQASSQLKSRPTFTVDINRGGQTLSFLCSYLPDDYPEVPEQLAVDPELGKEESPTALEDFQIDEFAIHEGDWNDKVYSADCAVIDGELYDKLLNLLEEHGIGEEFANQLMDFSTAYEHRQYIGLLEKLQKFSKQ